MADPIYIIGNTHKFLLIAEKDGVAWDITGGTITLYLEKPNGALLTKSATIISGPAGTAYYTTLTTDLSAAGRWKRWWKVVVGSIEIEYGPYFFNVRASAA